MQSPQKTKTKIFTFDLNDLNLFLKEWEEKSELKLEDLESTFSKIQKWKINSQILSKLIFNLLSQQTTIVKSELLLHFSILSNIPTETKLNFIFENCSNLTNKKILTTINYIFFQMNLMANKTVNLELKEEICFSSKEQFNSFTEESKIKEKLDIIYYVFHSIEHSIEMEQKLRKEYELFFDLIEKLNFDSHKQPNWRSYFRIFWTINQPFDTEIPEKRKILHTLENSPFDSQILFSQNEKEKKIKEFGCNFFHIFRKEFVKEEFKESFCFEQIIAVMLLGKLELLCCKRTVGKSSSTFFDTFDKKFFIKTIALDERQTLIANLYDFYQHLNHNNGTKHSSLLCLSYGVFEIGGNSFLLLENCLRLEKENFEEIYDLKGSVVGRIAPNESKVKFDLDLYKTFSIENHENFFEILTKDVSFLEKHNLLDYSCLLSVLQAKKVCLLPENLQKRYFACKDKEKVLLISIIDLNSALNNKKQVEIAFKSFMFKAQEISSCPPPQYASRFLEFLKKVILN